MNNNIITFIITDRDDNRFVKTIYRADNIMNYGNGVVIHEPKYLMTILNHVVDTFEFRLIIHLGFQHENDVAGLTHLDTLRSSLRIEDTAFITRHQEFFTGNQECCEYRGYKVYNTDKINTKDFIDSLKIFTTASIIEDKSVKETQEEKSNAKNSKKAEMKNEKQLTYSAETMNFFQGNGVNSQQVIKEVDSIVSNVSSNGDINVNEQRNDQIRELLSYLKDNMSLFDLNNEDREDLINESERIEKQLKRNSPKNNIIDSALNTINGILTGIAANAYTPIVLEKLSGLF